MAGDIEKAAFIKSQLNRQARRALVARKSNTRSAFDRFVRQTLRNIFNTSIFLLVGKAVGVLELPWYGIVAYPLIWWVCLFVVITAVAVYVGAKSKKKRG